MIQLTKAGLAGTANLKELASQFARSHVFRLPSLLHPELMQMISSRLEHCTWTTQDDGTIAKEALPGDPAPTSVLNFVSNTPQFLDLIRRMTGCHQMKCFGGRVYRMAPGTDHYDTWHSDIGKTHDRLLGMSINLGSRPYQGGILRLRDQSTQQVLCELPNTGNGDAIFFRISPTLQHMVTPLSGTEPKTAFAGWFQSGNLEYYSTLKQVSVDHSLTTAPNEEAPPQ